MKTWAKRTGALVVVLIVGSFFAQKLVGMPRTEAQILLAAILKPSDIGAGYRSGRYAHFDDLHRPTIWFCGISFPSEGLRDTRLQLEYWRGNWTRTHAADLTIENELVHYRPGGVAEAIDELRSAVSACPDFLHSAAPPQTNIGIGETLKPLVISGALPDTVAFTDHVTIPGHSARTTYIAYQPCGDYLSGLYVTGSRAAAMLESLVPVTAAKLCSSDGAPGASAGSAPYWG
ncbi:MAG TPA: hypothetical protein VGF80_02825 [Galbitalea sp.]